VADQVARRRPRQGEAGNSPRRHDIRISRRAGVLAAEILSHRWNGEAAVGLSDPGSIRFQRHRRGRHRSLLLGAGTQLRSDLPAPDHHRSGRDGAGGVAPAHAHGGILHRRSRYLSAQSRYTAAGRRALARFHAYGGKIRTQPALDLGMGRDSDIRRYIHAPIQRRLARRTDERSIHYRHRRPQFLQGAGNALSQPRCRQQRYESPGPALYRA
jgi:hypothetical protein